MKFSLRVSNLPIGIGISRLERMFDIVGHVKSARLDCNPKGISQGVGYVEMETAQEVQDGIQYYNGRGLEGRRLSVCAEAPAPFLLTSPQRPNK